MKPEFILATMGDIWDEEKALILNDPLADLRGDFVSEVIPDSKLVIAQREMLESNPTYRQIIPYVIVTYRGEILSYRRTSKVGEQRLAGKSSVGWGGHVDIAKDAVWNTDGSLCLISTLLGCVNRELDEELGLSSEDYGSPRVLGFIAGNETEVDKVHAGVVLKVELSMKGRVKITAEDELTDLKFENQSDIELGDEFDRMTDNPGELESWSRAIIQSVVI